jgi:transcriptional regulator with XRE-family HTH domain
MRQARERLGISQEELAARLHKKQRAISEYETGHRRMFVTDLPELARVLGVPVAFFFEGELSQDDLDTIVLSEFQRLPDATAKQIALEMLRLLANYTHTR